MLDSCEDKFLEHLACDENPKLTTLKKMNLDYSVKNKSADSDEDDSTVIQNVKRRPSVFSDSDSNDSNPGFETNQETNLYCNSSNDDNSVKIRIVSKKTRLNNSSSSDNDSGNYIPDIGTNKENNLHCNSSNDENKVKLGIDLKKTTLKKMLSSDNDSDKDDPPTDNSHPDIGTNEETKIRTGSKKTRLKNMSSSDNDSDNSNPDIGTNEETKKIIGSRKSRLTKLSSSDNDSVSSNFEGSDSNTAFKNLEQQARMKNKRNKLEDKFKHLNKVQKKDRDVKSTVSMTAYQANSESLLNDNKDYQSSSEDNEAASIEKIKQKIKERTIALKSTIYDPDSSDEECRPEKYDQKAARKSTNTTSKTVRMSAKEAMENMQKIKSESNRMLREKEVSLPYHRPKALALKDILNRRKLAVSSDGKALPLKMNDEQLKEYSKLLEQRQKEVIELCKSDSEDEEPSEENKEKHIEGALNALDNEKINSIDNVQNNIQEEERKIDDDADIIESSLSQHNDNEIINSEAENNNENVKSSDNNVKCDINNDISTEEAINNDISFDNLIQDSENDVSNKDKAEHKTNTNEDSQVISLHYDSEQIEINTDTIKSIDHCNKPINYKTIVENFVNKNQDTMVDNTDDTIGDDTLNNEFSDNEVDIEDVDRIIEQADIIQSQVVDSPLLIRESLNLSHMPRLTGAPGMVIDLDGNNATQSKKLTGVELLKQRFTYFNKLKSVKEIEQETQQKIKPGTQHIKLKQELEEQMAEQKSLEWTKRLEEERLRKNELSVLRGDESDEEDDIDKLEAKLAEVEPSALGDKADLSAESEPEENDIILEDKPRKKNALVDDEADESDCAENEVNNDEVALETDEEIDGEVESDDESSDDDSTDDNDDEVNNRTKQQKGRILKAFEDSDEEESNTEINRVGVEVKEKNNESLENKKTINSNSQDDELQSAQLQKSISEDLFTSQDTDLQSTKSITDSGLISTNTGTVDERSNIAKLPVIYETQPYDDAKFDEIAGMCSGSFSQNLVTTQIEPTGTAATQETYTQPLSSSPAKSQDNVPTETQELGDDVLALCTGKFYDNEFVSQQKENIVPEDNNIENAPKEDKSKDENLLKSILLELDDPEFENPKPNKFFANDSNTERNDVILQKKRLIIESDDEGADVAEKVIKKKRKKRKLQDRALQISDDEEEMSEEGDVDYESSDMEGDTERLVEYDSEENEVEIPIQQQKKTKRKTTEFFEQEAELTSEDEWVGSGDEDEAGLDRMEREEGDDDHFHQATLQRELGQIHMRDVLDQDKREVRLIQELLFEDGDLGDGHRQRKFRWKHMGDGDMGAGMTDDMTNTQEDEFESEEQWRKQRHEREVFLRQMMQKEGEGNESLNTSLDRTAIIKANLASKTMSSLLLEVNSPQAAKLETSTENKAKDLPSPVKKAFPTLQHNYRGSLLSRGSGTLARLAAIASPLATGDSDDNNRKIGQVKSGSGNFVFASVSPKPDQPKVTKRKKISEVGTPQLLKKMKTEETRDPSKHSLLDHMNV